MVKLQRGSPCRECPDAIRFPLWHGKVATQQDDKLLGQYYECFRFGMVKLQPHSQAVRLLAIGQSFRFGMVKLQPVLPMEKTIE